MKQLVIKDIRLLRFLNLIMVVLCMVLGFVGVNSMEIYKSKAVYILGTFILIYIVSMFTTQYDIKGNVDLMLNSFPVNRYEIVKARYISLAIYIIAIASIMFLSSNMWKIVFKNLEGNPAAIWDILVVIVLALIYFAIYLPFHYFNMGKAQLFNNIFYFLLLLMPNILGRYGDRLLVAKSVIWVLGRDLRYIMLMALGVSLILYIVSLSISRRIYENKEF